MAGSANLGRVQRTTLSESIPFSVHLELTHDCNLACGFCCIPCRDDRKTLDIERWLPVLDDLRELGTLMITVTGGEPLLHPQFELISDAVKRRRFAIRILSNGTLIDAEKAERIAALFPLAVEISIHGDNNATHDRITGVEGSFDAAWGGIRRLQERGVRVVVKTPITRFNVNQTDSIADRARRMGLPVRFDPTITPRDNGCTAPMKYAAEPEELRDVMVRAGATPPDALERHQGDVNCGLGRATLTIDPSGEVFPCSQWRSSSLGNVRTGRLTEIWRSSEERRRVREVAETANDRLISIGGAAAESPFCPAIAARITGDPFEPDARFLALARVVSAFRRNSCGQ